MDLDGDNVFCGTLIATHKVVQWMGSHVWKVGEKMFAVGFEKDGQLHVTFKVTPLSFDILKEQAGLRPAPHLASRGMSWIQHYAEPGLDDEALQDYLRASHGLVAAGLSKKKQRDFGLSAGD
ncbi:MAG: MmcQ/YjbR family DNA-binding protein [Pseudomonadota bacterium]